MGWLRITCISNESLSQIAFSRRKCAYIFSSHGTWFWYNLCGGNFLQPILHCHKFSELSNDVLEISDKEFLSSFTRRHFPDLMTINEANNISSTFMILIWLRKLSYFQKFNVNQSKMNKIYKIENANFLFRFCTFLFA